MGVGLGYGSNYAYSGMMTGNGMNPINPINPVNPNYYNSMSNMSMYDHNLLPHDQINLRTNSFNSNHSAVGMPFYGEPGNQHNPQYSGAHQSSAQPGSMGAGTVNQSGAAAGPNTDPTPTESELLKDDCRKFNPINWHLEPKVRFLSYFYSARVKIEPPGIDTILKRVGFKAATDTIPKVIQRRVCDNLDKIFSIILLKMTLFVLSLDQKEK